MNIKTTTRKEAFQAFLKKNSFYILLIAMYLILATMFRFMYLMTWRNLNYDEAWTILRSIEFYFDPQEFWGLRNNQPPLTFMIVGLFGLVFGSSYETSRVLSALLGILFGLLLLIFFIQKYPKRKISLTIIAVSLTIDWTLLFRFKTGDLNSLVIFIGMICFLGIYFCMKKDTYWSNALVGVFYGIVMNTKWTLVFVIIPYVFEFIYSLATVKKRSLEEETEIKKLVIQRILKAALALGTFLILFLPYFITILLNGNFAATYSFHSERFSALNFDYLKYYIVYSPFICVFGLIGILRLVKKRAKLYHRVLLYSLASFIWLFVIPSYADFSTLHCFMPFVAFEGMIVLVDFISPKTSSKDTKLMNSNDTTRALEKEENMEEKEDKTGAKLQNVWLKIQNKIQTKGPLNKTIIVFTILFLLFPTGYLLFRFHDNSHDPKIAQINAANYINDYLQINPLSENELISVPLTMGLLVHTEQWIDSYEAANDNLTVLEGYLLNNLTLFCFDNQFWEIKPSAQNSIIFQMAKNNTTELIDGTMISMNILSNFTDGYHLYYLYDVVRT